MKSFLFFSRSRIGAALGSILVACADGDDTNAAADLADPAAVPLPADGGTGAAASDAHVAGRTAPLRATYDESTTRAEGTRKQRILDSIRAPGPANTVETMQALQGDTKEDGPDDRRAVPSRLGRDDAGGQGTLLRRLPKGGPRSLADERAGRP